jgi:NAD(P)-dependent dehydrogenase (short-subunit alcohol dehydrogenase family)
MQIKPVGAVALITGAASGIGRATAVMLAGMNVRIAAADRDVNGLDALGKEIDALTIPTDVLKPAEVEQAVDRAEAELGPLSILVTAAGVLQRPRDPATLPIAEWDRIMAVNLRGTYLAAAAAGSRMAKRGTGTIVTVSSVMGYSPGLLHAYGPAKAALISLTQSLATQWGSCGVRVNGVAPGFTLTPALTQAMAFGVLKNETLASANPQARLITAQEVAAVIAFLASNSASAINGVTIPVDGGYLASAGLRGFGD